MSKIKVFNKEVKDGVADLVSSQASIAYCSEASIHKGNIETISDKDCFQRIVAENKGQIDLYYLESVLVSTGWNKNDDVFLSDATWQARNTPEDKQFNYMHDENDIIGHITGSYILDKSGKAISKNQEIAPEDFDIITQAVLYNSWTNPENKDRMDKIISEIEEGKWFVSMECLFAGFDYAVIDKLGNSKIVSRNEDSAFLTKHLRSYGGSGEYEGYKIGRALRQISFSGKGLVSKPANPRSIIFVPKTVATFIVSEQDVNFSIGEKNMADTTILEKQLAELQTELASAKEENATIKAKIEEAKDKEIASKISAYETTISENAKTIADLEENIKSTQARIAELEDALAKSNDQLSAAMKDMEEMKKKEKMQKRMATLIEAGFDQEEVNESLASFESLADEVFDSVVAAMKKKMAKMYKKEEEKPMAEVATPETFENVETTEASLVETVTQDETQTTRASIASWLENNILNKKK
jgi:hypothetical protein